MRRLVAILLVFGTVAADDAKPKGPGKSADPKAKKQVVLAVIVHPKNPVKKLSFSELRAYLKVKRQFWPNKERCRVFLPGAKSDAYSILLERVYKMSHKKLQKYWVRKLFSGQIPAKPDFVSSPDAAGSQVRKSLGALSVVPSDQVPKGAKVLPIDGRRPTDKGYALVGTIKP